jgi:tRNA nucleotidyltransferase/poly(A) polymerase
VATDGRRAVVAFSKDIAADARRRDFTLNALYAKPDGQVVDPLGGLDDCLNRRIRFIENADVRIREDYLRILRYFRFHAWYAKPDAGLEPDTLDAVARNIGGLETLSAERTGAEMLRLLAAPDPAPAVSAMRQTGCLALVLPGSDDRYLGPVVHLETTINVLPHPLRRLAALGGTAPEAALRLSRSEARRLRQVRDASYGPAPLSEISYRSGRDVAVDALLLRAALAERPIDRHDLAAIDAGLKSAFPVSARDLMPAYQGAALGEKLANLEAQWIASGFALTREDLLGIP